MKIELLTHQLEVAGAAASIEEAVKWTIDQPYLVPLALVITVAGGAYGLWSWHQQIVDYSRRLKTTRKFSEINEHGAVVPTPDEFANTIADLRIVDYAKDPKLRSAVQGAIERVKKTKEGLESPQEKGSGTSRP